MSEDDPEARRLQELEERLKKAREQGRPPREAPRPSKLGIAFQLVADLLAAVLVGGAIGWGLDRLFGTSPVLLIAMFLIGAATGMRNMMRTARKLNEGKGRSGR